jgi:hypothetical protein
MYDFRKNLSDEYLKLGPFKRAIRQKFSTPGISELSVQNIRDSGEMLSKGRCKTTSGFFVIPLFSQSVMRREKLL